MSVLMSPEIAHSALPTEFSGDVVEDWGMGRG